MPSTPLNRCAIARGGTRDFVPWRFLDAGCNSAWIVSASRRPKTCTKPEVPALLWQAGKFASPPPVKFGATARILAYHLWAQTAEWAMIDVVVTQRVNAGMEEAFETIAREVTANTLSQDKGCLRYEWYRAEAPQTYILIERWTDQAAAQAHINADHIAALMPRIRDCVPEKFSTMRLTRIE